MSRDFRIAGLRRWLRLDRDSAVEREVDDEIRFHFESRIEELMRTGMTRNEARLAADLEFGDVGSARRELTALDQQAMRRRLRSSWTEAIGQDLRDAIRSLRASPGFCLAVVLIIAAGVGANATMFGIVDRILLQPPPHVQNADRIGRVRFTQTISNLGIVTRDMAGFEQYDMLRDAKTIEAAAAFANSKASTGRGLTAREVEVSGVTASFFPLLGLHPTIGRFFAPGEDQPPRGEDVAVISDRLWRTDFAGRDDALGRRLLIGARSYEIIGVAPAGFTGIDLDGVDVWLPLAATGFEMLGDDWRKSGVATWLRVLIRRRPDVSVGQVNAELTLRFARVRRDIDLQYGGRIDPTVRAAVGSLVAAKAADIASHAGEARSARVTVWLFAMSALVLFTACANVANLIVARSIRRRREIAVRIALGISRARLLRQLIAEGALLALAGVAAGLITAIAAGSTLRHLLLPSVDWDVLPELDGRLLMFLGVAVGVVTVLTAVGPAIQASRMSSLVELRQGTQGGGLRASRLRASLLVAQAALAAILLVASGLFVRSLHNVLGVPLGFDAGQVLLVDYHTGDLNFRSDPRKALYDRARETALSVPGVTDASIALTAPFRTNLSGGFHIPGVDSLPKPKDGVPFMNGVSPSFFSTTGIRILRGRAFTDADRADAARVMIVGATMARRYWKGADPIGACVKQGSDTMPCTTIVGIAADTHRASLDDESFQFYVPLTQVKWSLRMLFVRVRGDPVRVIPSLRKRLATLAPGLPFVDIRTLDSLVDPQREAWRLGAIVFTIFGGLAVAIATFGLYALIAYEVARRRREFGIRLALGAPRAHIVHLVTRDGVTLVLVGLSTGCLLSLLANSSVQSLLFRTSARDATVYGIVAGVMLATALVACLVPSYRAAELDPRLALNAD